MVATAVFGRRGSRRPRQGKREADVAGSPVVVDADKAWGRNSMKAQPLCLCSMHPDHSPARQALSRQAQRIVGVWVGIAKQLEAVRLRTTQIATDRSGCLISSRL